MIERQLLELGAKNQRVAIEDGLYIVRHILPPEHIQLTLSYDYVILQSLTAAIEVYEPASLPPQNEPPSRKRIHSSWSHPSPSSWHHSCRLDRSA